MNISNVRFLGDFRENDRALKRGNGGRPVAWVIGTTAANTSNLERAGDFARDMMTEMHAGLGGHPPAYAPLEEWAIQRFGHLAGFSIDRAANYLRHIYHERYQNDPVEGCRRIDGILEQASPSIGYGILADIMANEPHRVAINSYFDNLVADAITTYMGVIPNICGHESVMRYLASQPLRRPLVVKLQRDLMLAPKADIEEIDELPRQWDAPLAHIFQHYMAVIVGYGDRGAGGGTLISFLENLPPQKRPFYWCYVEGPEGKMPAKEVVDLVNRLGGHLVPILGFDELMLQLWEELALASMRRALRARADDLVRSYEESFLKLARTMERGSYSDSDTALTSRESARRALERWSMDASLA